MIKLICSLLILMSTVIAQNEEPDPFEFFPSSVGNYWEYDSDSPELNDTIKKDSIGQDGSIYLWYSQPERYYGADFRIDTIGNVFRRPQFSPSLEYKLSADSGVSWMVVDYSESGGGNRIEAFVDDTFKSTIFGDTTEFKRIYYYELYDGDTTITESSIHFLTRLIAKGFGLVWFYRDADDWPTELQGCIINGKKYGTLVSVEGKEEQTFNYSLSQNYPNPFNPSTTIKYTTPPSPYQGEGSRVRLKVYDILGREIKTLLNKPMQPGSYEVEFNGSNLTSGVYFYVLETGGNRLTKKMLLVK